MKYNAGRAAVTSIQVPDMTYLTLGRLAAWSLFAQFAACYRLRGAQTESAWPAAALALRAAVKSRSAKRLR